MSTTRADARGRLPHLLLLGALLSLVWTLLPPPPAAAQTVHSTTTTIGRSLEGRPIVAHRRWHAGATRTVLVVGSLHGDEKAGTVVAQRLLKRALPANVNLWVVPTLNPDGARRSRRTNARGVDLNRNFPHEWRRQGGGTAKYSGARPASEPETKALLRLVKRIRPRTTIVFHQPLYGVDSYRAKSMPLVRALSRTMGLPVRRFACGGVCRGTLTGWHNKNLPGRAVTVELGRRPKTGSLDRAARAVLQVGSSY